MRRDVDDAKTIKSENDYDQSTTVTQTTLYSVDDTNTVCDWPNRMDCTAAHTTTQPSTTPSLNLVCDAMPKVKVKLGTHLEPKRESERVWLRRDVRHTGKARGSVLTWGVASYFEIYAFAQITVYAV